jgi:hypothetical protein
MDVSFLQRPIYRTPQHIIDKIKADPIYGNPPFRTKPDISWNDVKDCAELGLTLADAASTLDVHVETLRRILPRNPAVSNMFDRNPARGMWKARRGYAPDSEIPPMKFKEPFLKCAICGEQAKRTGTCQKHCKPCEKIAMQRCSRKHYLQRRKLKGTTPDNSNHPWRRS